MNPYNINPLGGYDVGRGISQIGNAFAGMRQREQQALEKQEAQQKQEQMQQLYSKAAMGDAEAIGQLYATQPKMGQLFEQRQQEKVQALGAAQAQESKRAETDWGLKWIQSETPEQKQVLLQEALNNPLIDIDESDLGGEAMSNDIAVRAMVYGNLGKDAYNDLITSRNETAKETNFAPTVSALQTDPNTGQQYTVITDRNNNQSVRKNVDGAIAQSLEQEQDAAFRGKSLDDSRQLSKEMFGELRGVKSQIGTINEAIKAIDKGASSGAFDKFFPSFRESTIALENAAQRMGLDVIAATTFGALSEGELKLAMDTAVPKNLKPKELKKWLSDRRTAKIKLANELSKMAIELGKGKTTVAEYLAKNASFTPKEEQAENNKAVQQGSNNQDEQALQWARSNPDDPRSGQILKKLGAQ